VGQQDPSLNSRPFENLRIGCVHLAGVLRPKQV